MKRFLFLSSIFLYTTQLIAKEGMWLPFLLEQMNQKEMRNMGMKIKASDIYDVNAGSLKDAVVIFGSGCTGEVISDKGLVLTNHHCGYGTVQGLSTVEHNYLKQGFWAKNSAEELPCPGLTVTFIIRIDDVTEEVLASTAGITEDSTRQRMITTNIADIEKRTKKESGYETLIKSFFYENEYYLFYMEKFTDVRLVGFPPNGIGKFGGDTDNWSWPRHTGDFGLFRIYADSSNKPAAYHAKNIPFKPRRFMKINTGGMEEGDFTWVYGFPGKTTEYLTSDGVREIVEVLDPIRISLREKRLGIIEAAMKKSEKLFIQYASKQASIANYYKKWKGELLGLNRNDAIHKKEEQEKNFLTWVHADSDRTKNYGAVLAQLKAGYENQMQSVKELEYLNEAVFASELLKKTEILKTLRKSLDTLNDISVLKKYVTELANFHKGIDKETDQLISQELMDIYFRDIEKSNSSLSNVLRVLYNESLMSSSDKLAQLLASNDKLKIQKGIDDDLAYQTFIYFDQKKSKLLENVKQSQLALNKLYRTYIQGLREWKPNEQFYPDANSTLRVSYGVVEGIAARDGMQYTPFTTLDGAVAKHSSTTEEFTLPTKLLDLHAQKDYGSYAVTNEQGETSVPLAFLASNHTTGGNSGSPVLNAKGELIGTNFDRIWEGTMSDVMYDINRCRNIVLDIRYTLFIIEKYGGAKWLIDEMEVVQ